MWEMPAANSAAREAVMASAWIEKRTTKHGERRFRVCRRAGGREAPSRYGGWFRTEREAKARRSWIVGELAQQRLPDAVAARAADSADVLGCGGAWRAARVDVAASTALQHRIQLDKLIPLIGKQRLDDVRPPQHFIDAVSRLHADGVARETIRKTLGAGAMVLDHAGVAPNPARDRSMKLPRRSPTR